MSLALAPKTLASLVGQAQDAALPALIMDARRAGASIIMGEHGKRRGGSGDNFWQHREWSNGESLRQIDWRHSARTDKLFVREREHQVPALLQIWCDCRAGMQWTSTPSLQTKAQRGLVLGLALALAAQRGGERICALGSGVPFVEANQFADVLLESGKQYENKILGGQVVMMSDGLESADVWAARAKSVSSARAQLLVVLIADEAEANFPFQGRMLFRAASEDQSVIVGRAEVAREAYQSAYQAHMSGVVDAIKSYGGEVVSHMTHEPLMPTLLRLAGALDQGFVKTGAY
jgi:uncharacterized protein (DUF58 family)